MLIVCPSCTTSYQVEPASLGGEGRSVRCARCRNTWFATSAAAAPIPAVAGADQWDVIDTGPRVPAVDAPSRPARRDPPPPLGMATRTRPPADAAPEPPAVASTGNIDVAGLGAAIETERAEQEAVADAVLAEVTSPHIAPADSPPEIPAAGAAPRAGARSGPDAEAPGGDVETVATRRLGRKPHRGRWLTPSLPLAVAVLALVNISLVLWRGQVVQLLPQTASLYAAIGLPVNIRGLSFEDVRMSRTEQDSIAVLMVEGSIVNVTRKAMEVPRLRLAVRNEAGQEIYSWTAQPARSVLGPGETLPFRSRLASPPAEARDILVRFFNRRDLVAGLN